MKFGNLTVTICLALSFGGCGHNGDQRTVWIAVDRGAEVVQKNYCNPVQLPDGVEIGQKRIRLPKSIEISNLDNSFEGEKVLLKEGATKFFLKQYFDAVKELNIKGENVWLSLCDPKLGYRLYSCGKVTFGKDSEGLLVLMETIDNDVGKQLVLFTVRSGKLFSFIVLSAERKGSDTSFIYDRKYDAMYLLRDVDTNANDLFPKKLIGKYSMDSCQVKMCFTYVFEISQNGKIQQPGVEKRRVLGDQLPEEKTGSTGLPDFNVLPNVNVK